jgi:hypothetical protein
MSEPNRPSKIPKGTRRKPSAVGEHAFLLPEGKSLKPPEPASAMSTNHAAEFQSKGAGCVRRLERHDALAKQSPP